MEVLSLPLTVRPRGLPATSAPPQSDTCPGPSPQAAHPFCRPLRRPETLVGCTAQSTQGLRGEGRPCSAPGPCTTLATMRGLGCDQGPGHVHVCWAAGVCPRRLRAGPRAACTPGSSPGSSPSSSPGSSPGVLALLGSGSVLTSRWLLGLPSPFSLPVGVGETEWWPRGLWGALQRPGCARPGGPRSTFSSRLCRRRPEAPAGVARAGMLQSRTLRCHFLHFCIMFTGHGTVFISYKPLKMGKTAGPREAGVRGGCAPAPCGGPVRPGCGRLLPSGVMGCDPCSQSTGGSSEGAAGLRVTTCGPDPRQGAVCWCCTCVLCHRPSRGDQEGPSEEAALDRSLWGLGVLLPPRPVLWPAPGPHSASSSGVGRGHSGGRQSG